MDFQSLNTDHAVQSVVFSIVLDGSITNAIAQALAGRQDLLSELPAVQTPEAIEFASGAGPVAPRRLAGVQLSHLRPDGTPAWSLRLIGNELAVECTRYTRWDKVWEAAARYIRVALDVVGTGERPRKAIVVGLNFTDVFIANREDYNLSTLLKPCDLLAQKIFSAGPTWNNNIGWFDLSPEPEAFWLNSVNIVALRIPNQLSNKRLQIQISHNQEHRLKKRTELPDLLLSIDAQMQALHINNKNVLGRMLSDECVKQISLFAGEPK